MKRSSEGLVRYNAQRCEEALSKRCVCHCGGKLHGKAHSEQWIKETARLIDELHERQAALDKPADFSGLLPL